jgi:hypothetical protein
MDLAGTPHSLTAIAARCPTLRHERLIPDKWHVRTRSTVPRREMPALPADRDRQMAEQEG